MRVVYLESAARDIAWFRYYYRSIFPEGSDSARTNLWALQRLLAANPYIGHPSEDRDGVRGFAVKKTPFTVIYRVTREQIEILRLWDNRQGESL